MKLTVDIRNKTYPNGCRAISHLAFAAEPGEFIAVVGPSGTGKSTLLNLIAGLDRDVDGRIVFQPDRAASRTEPKIGYLFQEPRLMPWLTVRQNLELVLTPQVRRQTAVPVDELLTQVGLRDCGAMYPAQLSGGMQRRVAMLRAFIVEPDVLLMDEPFQSLDAPTAEQLRGLLRDMWQRSRPTVLFVTHSLREALSLADRVLFLSGRPAQVILDFPVGLRHARSIEDAAVQDLYASLLGRYPQLLVGLLAGS